MSASRPPCALAPGTLRGALRTGFAFVLVLLTAARVVHADSDWPTPLGARTVVCFPPGVPIFGDAIADGDRTAGQRQYVWAPPPTLADYVNESFYPALSTRLVHHTLGSRMEARLEAFRATRSGLINELADQLLALNGVDATAREAELAAFAEQQRPRIVALERDAEALRRDLVSGGLLQGNVDWNRARRWRLGETHFAGEPVEREAEFQVMRAAAFYEDGFVSEQRGLLLEITAELRVRARAARPMPEARTDDPAAMFFSPAMSRLRLPKNATPTLVALMARFNRIKLELKSELRDAVLEHDKADREERAAVFEALAQRQWPRFEELESVAEEIRVELARLPTPPLRLPPAIPEELVARVDTYNRDRQKMIRDFQQTVQVANTFASSRPVSPSAKSEARREIARQMAEERAALRAAAARGFQEASREQIEQLKQRYDAIRADLEVAAAGQIDPETGRPFTGETLLRGYFSAIERFDTFGREEVIYRGYRLAMLMPGLSREQRRLLFGAALVGLAQPLPAGETMPLESRPVPRS